MLKSFVRMSDAALQRHMLKKKILFFGNMPNAYFCSMIYLLLINKWHITNVTEKSSNIGMTYK